MGSFYTRPNSPYIWIKYYQNGRAVRESTGTTKKTVARRVLRTREGDVERGVPINPKMGRITFEEASTHLLNDYKNNGRKTHDHAKRRIELHLKPVFKGSACCHYDAGHPGVHHRTQAAGASNGEINRELACLKRMFLAVHAGQLHGKPHIPMLREDNVRRGFFEPDQFTAVAGNLPAAIQPLASSRP